MKIKQPIPLHRFAKKDIPFDIEKLDAKRGENYEATHLPHRHSYYEIFIFYKGGGLHKIDFNEYKIETGSLHFISPGQVHLMKRRSSCHGYVITFPEELYAVQGQQQFLQQIAVYNTYAFPPIISCSAAQMKTFKTLVQRIEKEYSSGGVMREELMRSYLNVLLVHCNRIFLEKYKITGPATPMRKTDIVRDFRQLLELNFLHVQGVQEYAGMLTITPGHLSDTIKKATGSTASALIHERVILEAKRLLLNTNYSVKEIAFTLNYDDPTYFVRFFKKCTGFTPGDFREQIREKYHQ